MIEYEQILLHASNTEKKIIEMTSADICVEAADWLDAGWLGDIPEAVSKK